MFTFITTFSDLIFVNVFRLCVNSFKNGPNCHPIAHQCTLHTKWNLTFKRGFCHFYLIECGRYTRHRHPILSRPNDICYMLKCKFELPQKRWTGGTFLHLFRNILKLDFLLCFLKIDKKRKLLTIERSDAKFARQVFWLKFISNSISPNLYF